MRQAAGRRFSFVPADSWAQAVELIRSRPVELAVIDPALEGQPRTHEIERIGILFPSLPRILYATLSPEMALVLLKLGHAGIRDLVVAGHDDQPEKLSDMLVTAAARAVSRKLIDEIADLLAGWPGELRWAIETILRDPEGLHSVGDLAARAKMDRRTCTRWFTRANLPPPSVVLMVVRVVYAHRLLQDPGYTVEDVASKLGYKPRSLVQNFKEVFGMTPGEVRVSLTPDEAVETVRDRYLRTALPGPLASVS